MRKWTKWIFISLTGFILLFIVSLFLGGQRPLQHYLSKARNVGGGRLQLFEPRFHWSLNLAIDSAVFENPSLRVKLDQGALSLSLFRSLIHFAPVAQLEIDAATVQLYPSPDSVKVKRDSIPFPKFKLPAEIGLRINQLTLSDSAGEWGILKKVELKTTGLKSLTLLIHEAEMTRENEKQHFGAMRPALQASLDWNKPASISTEITLTHSRDTLFAKAELTKADILKGQMELRLQVASSQVYAKALGLSASLPSFEYLTSVVHGVVDSGSHFTVESHCRITDFPEKGSWRLSPQQTSLKLSLDDSDGSWSLTSHAKSPAVSMLAQGKEDIQLSGRFFATERTSDSIHSVSYRLRHMGVTAKGHVRGVTVVTAGKKMTADLILEKSKFSQGSIQVQALSGEGSRFTADAERRLLPSSRGLAGAYTTWRGQFSADLVQGERWVTVFTDTNLAFKKFHLEGHGEGGFLTATTQVEGLKAYGTWADSASLQFRYHAKALTLLPSKWSSHDQTWNLYGTALFEKQNKTFSLHLQNPTFGKANFTLARLDSLSVHAQNFALDQLPYRGMDRYAPYHPVISGEFLWMIKRGIGRADVSGHGILKGQAVEAHLDGDWTRELLRVKLMKATLSGSSASLAGEVKMHGRPFYSLGGIKVVDVGSVSVASDHFNLAKAWSLAKPSSPLKSGNLVGKFSYNDSTGFAGNYALQDFQLQGEASKVSVKNFTVSGKQDTLVIHAITASDKEPLLNDTLVLTMSDALGKIQPLSIQIFSPNGTATFLGKMREYRELEGHISVNGDMVLPGRRGELKGLALRAKLTLPFKLALQGLKLDADTLLGTYMAPGLDTQQFSAKVKTLDGRISLSNLLIKGNGGEMTGKIDYAIATRRMSAVMEGQSLSAVLGEGQKIQLRDFRLDAQMDSSGFNLQAAIGGASAERIKHPLRATGDFSKISVLYRNPFSPAKYSKNQKHPLPFLRVSAVMDSSSIRYRLRVRSLESLKNIFKKSPAARQIARRARPMQVQLNLETTGYGNTIETDAVRFSYVGNVSMVGTYPYALVRGRLSSRDGTLGTRRQAYRIRHIELKWLNSPLEEGILDLESEKKLARACDGKTTDSCSVIMRLGGPLNNLQFSYDSDCKGSYGAGVEVAALIYSVRRGCYSPGFSTGGDDLTVEQQALTLLEVPLNGWLSDRAEKLSGSWIASAQVTGLGVLASDKFKKDTIGLSSAAPGASSHDAIALEILSKEFWKVRLRAKSAYKPDIAEDVNPWAYLVGLEWRPPLYRFIDNPVWKQRVKNHVNLDASLFTDPDRTQSTQDKLLRRLGLNYTYDFWGYWWSKPKSEDPDRGKPHQSQSAIVDSLR